MPPEPLLSPRAGFWRRLGAFTIDMLMGGLVIAVLGTLAYSQSGGRVQTAPFAVTIKICADKPDIPVGLTPSPPDDSNYASECSYGSFPGLTMTRVLVVGRRVASFGRVMETGQAYPLAADGSQVAAFDASWLGQLGVATYLAAALCLRGTTVGMRLLHIRMIRPSDPEKNGVPLVSLLIRAAVAVGGLVPALVLGIAAFVWTQRDAAHAPTGLVILLAAMTAVIWMLWNTILIGRKLDPIYDRASGLAVIRG